MLLWRRIATLQSVVSTMSQILSKTLLLPNGREMKVLICQGVPDVGERANIKAPRTLRSVVTYAVVSVSEGITVRPEFVSRETA